MSFEKRYNNLYIFLYICSFWYDATILHGSSFFAQQNHLHQTITPADLFEIVTDELSNKKIELIKL